MITKWEEDIMVVAFKRMPSLAKKGGHVIDSRVG